MQRKKSAVDAVAEMKKDLEELVQRELQGQTKKLEEVLTLKNERQMATMGTVRRGMRNP